MPSFEDTPNLYSGSNATMSTDDLLVVFDVSTANPKKLSVAEFDSRWDALQAYGDGENRLYSGYLQDALATPVTIAMQTGEAEGNQFNVTELSSRAGTIDSVNMNTLYAGSDPTVTLIGYLGYGNDALIIGPASKSQMVVSGLTDDNETPLGGLALAVVLGAYDAPKLLYADPLEPGNYCEGSALEGWLLVAYDAEAIFRWRSTAAVVSPDLVPEGAYNVDTNPDGWVAEDSEGNTAGGTPICTPALPTAGQIVDAINASGYALAGLVGDGTGTVVNEEVTAIRQLPVFVDSYADDAAATTAGLLAYALYFNTTTDQFTVVAPA